LGGVQHLLDTLLWGKSRTVWTKVLMVVGPRRSSGRVSGAVEGWLVGGVVGLLDGGADPAAVGDLVAVGSGPFADLRELLTVGTGGGAESPRTHRGDSRLDVGRT
jgi:hypothetical protein